MKKKQSEIIHVTSCKKQGFLGVKIDERYRLVTHADRIDSNKVRQRSIFERVNKQMAYTDNFNEIDTNLIRSFGWVRLISKGKNFPHSYAK